MRATVGIDQPKKVGDAGYDLHADHDANIYAGNWESFDCASVEIPDGYCGLIIGRSSNNGKGLLTVFGLIDSGYRGKIRVMLLNMNGNTVLIDKGDRIAQLVLIPYGNFPIEYVDSIDEDTERGTSGFGSTGQ